MEAPDCLCPIVFIPLRISSFPFGKLFVLGIKPTIPKVEVQCRRYNATPSDFHVRNSEFRVGWSLFPITAKQSIMQCSMRGNLGRENGSSQQFVSNLLYPTLNFEFGNLPV